MARRYRQVMLKQDVLDWGLSGPYPGSERERTVPRPDPNGEPIPWENVATLATGRDAFAAALGLTFQRTDDCGLGWVDVAILDLPSGARVGLMYYEGNPAPEHRMHVKVLPQQFVDGSHRVDAATATWDALPTDHAARQAAVEAATARAPDAVLRELTDVVGPDLVRVTWLRPTIDPGVPADAPQRTWEVWRQDDAGSRHLVQDRLTEQEARAVTARYESRGHKQTYWAKRAGAGHPL
jgi:hypothetical protein